MEDQKSRVRMPSLPTTCDELSMNSHLSRRDWLALTALGLAVPSLQAAPPTRRFGFSLYGMKTLTVAEALSTCAQIGYDGVELALLPGWHADPAKLSPADRRDLRQRLADQKLGLFGLMENLTEPAPDDKHRANLDRLTMALDLARDLDPKTPPPIETVLGGVPRDWEKVRDRLVARLGDWAELAAKAKVVIAVKPHVAHALHTVAGAIWLMEQLKSPWIKLALDISHFQLRGVAITDVVDRLAPLSVFTHVKDAKGTAEKFEFLLPGEGTTDYTAYLGRLRQVGYAGPIVVEVSSHLFNKPGYDPRAAARACYASLAEKFPR